MSGDLLDKITGVIVTDRFDRRLYSHLRRDSEALAELEMRGREQLPTLPGLVRDFWAGLYKTAPRQAESVPSSLQLNQRLLSEAMALPEWAELRQSTRLDEWASALGALSFGEKALENLPAESQAAVRAAWNAEQAAQELLDQAAAYQDGARLAEAAGNHAQAQELQDQAAAFQAQAEPLLAQAAASAARVQLAGRQLRKLARQAAAETATVLDETAAFIRWGTESGQPGRRDRRETFELARQLQGDPKLREIAQLAGRMTRIALEKRRSKIKQEPSEVASVESGRDLARVLPVELALVGHPILKLDFFRRFTEGNLLQCHLEGKDREGRGPIVTCLDSSGSMLGPKEIWSKAVTLALFQVAARERRAFACIHFGSADELKLFEFLPDARNAPAVTVAEMAAFFFGGGTDFERPLSVAVEVMDKDAFTCGDVVFVTDGECGVSGEFLEKFRRKRQEQEFSVYSIVMPGGLRNSVAVFSDQVVWAEPGNDGEALDLVFSSV